MSEATPEKTVKDTIPRRKRSFVWQYFVKTPHPNHLKCTECNQISCFKRKSTGNLVRHIRLKHPALYASATQHKSILHSQLTKKDELSVAVAQIIQDDDEDSAGPPDTEEIQSEKSVEMPSVELPRVHENQIQQAMVYYMMEQITDNRTNEIDKQILKIIVKEFYPLTLIKNQEFISFVRMLNSNYALPDCSSLSEKLLNTYQTAVENLKSTLNGIKYIALTIDRWSSIDDENFIAVTAHFLDKDLTLKNSFLDCTSFPEDSSINIPIFLQELVGNWRISEKIVAVVAENDPTIVEAIKECQWQHIDCFAHTLNKIIMACLAKLNDVITKIRNIVDYFKRNPNAKTELQSHQNEMGITNTKFKRDIPNRWNSTYDMMTSFLKHKDFLQTQSINLPSELSVDDWLALENAVKLLAIFDTITAEICSEEVLSLSKVPHMIRFMIKHVTNIMEKTTLPDKIYNMGKELKKELLKQSKVIETNDIICQNVLLDPRLKKRGFSGKSFDVAYSSLLNNVISLKNEKVHETWAAQSSVQNETKQEFYIDVWSEFRETEKLPPKRDFTPDATAEIDAFLIEAYTSMKENPMSYWSNEINQNKSPVLFELVKSRLCIPASSVPCKNMFSQSGNALVERRNSLPSNTLKEVLFLHHNL